MLSQLNISATTPLGATVIPGGVTFRVWAPRAQAVYLNPDVAANGSVQLTNARMMRKDTAGYWTALEPGAVDGFLYRYYVVGNATSGYKRDPYARELKDGNFPNCYCIVRDADTYPWHDAGFISPDLPALIIYQFHIGVFAVSKPGVSSNFLDVVGKVEYLAELGINLLQPLPIDEQGGNAVGMGYAGADIFSPDFPYVCNDPAALPGYLTTINALLAKKGQAALTLADITPGVAQLKVLVDLVHLYGMAIAFDVVYGHGGGFEGDDHSYYYMDRFAPFGPNNNGRHRGRSCGIREKEQALQNDEAKAKQMLELLPKAFVFQNAHMEGAYERIEYKPNPDYQPQDLEKRVLHGMSRSMLVEPKSARLRELEGHLPVDVSIGLEYSRPSMREATSRPNGRQ